MACACNCIAGEASDIQVSKTCPKSLQRHFPALWPSAAAGSEQGLAEDIVGGPTLDAAPAGQQHFVYKKQRGENPICRLEMKYPKQKEVFYLRHMLLNHAKTGFKDCRVHAGKTYSTIEEAMVATGYFIGTDEAACVRDVRKA